MAKKVYIGVNRKARNVKRILVGDENGVAREVIKGYIGDENGKARQFWGALGYVIFDNGEWHYVPQGFDLVQNYAETNGKVSDLSADYLTDKLLWVHEVAISNQWDVDDEDYLNSNYTDYSEQITKNEIYIPIDRISSPSKLRIIGKGNLMFTACRINNGSMVKSNLGGICSENLAVKEIDISGQAYIDYIEVLAPNEYESTNEAVTNPYVYQPIPFIKTNHLYTNNNGFGLPGYEINQLSGGQMYCFIKYREPDGNEQCLYIMSKEAFSIELIGRWGNPPTREVINSTQLQADPPIHAVIRESYWWGYKWQNIPIWHTNYRGGWNMYWDIDVGNIVLYGKYNILDVSGEISSETKSVLWYPDAYDDVLPIKLMNFPFDVLQNNGVPLTFNLKYNEKRVYAALFVEESTGRIAPYLFSDAPFSHTMGPYANEYWANPITHNGYTYYCIQWFNSTWRQAPGTLVNMMSSLRDWYGWDTAHILYTGNEGKAVVTEDEYSLQQIKRIEVIGGEIPNNNE